MFEVFNKATNEILGIGNFIEFENFYKDHSQRITIYKHEDIILREHRVVDKVAELEDRLALAEQALLDVMLMGVDTNV